MKKTIQLLLLFVLMVNLTGCVKYNVDMEIRDNKSMTLQIVYGMEVSDDIFEFNPDDSEDFIIDNDESDEGVSVDDYAYLKDKGFSVEKFVEEKDDTTISGVKITKTYTNIDEITDSKNFTLDFNKMFDEENKNAVNDVKFFSKKGNKYVANFVFDFSDATAESSALEMMDSMLELQYKVKLPNKNVRNNATSVSDDGSELVWDLKYGTKNEVNFEFSFNDDINWIPVIIIGIGIFAAAVLAILFIKRRKINNKPQENIGETVISNDNLH